MKQGKSFDEALKEVASGKQVSKQSDWNKVTPEQVSNYDALERVIERLTGKKPAEIYNSPNSTFVASFVGSPAINLFAARMDKDRLVLLEDKFAYTLPKKIVDRIGGRQGEIIAGVRPEDIVIDTGANGDTCAATVYNLENMGMEKIVTLQIDRYIFKAVTSADFDAAVNDQVHVRFKHDKVHFFDRESGVAIT
jgi:sn-glycerol 3-phosphate transport system ATP-binding protein